MNRRNFLRSSAGGVGTLAAMAVVPAYGFPAAPAAMPSTVHVLGAEPTDGAQRLIKAMSDDVFEQLRQRFRAAYRTKTLKVTAYQYVGDGPIRESWHAAVRVDLCYAGERPPEFPLETFRRETACWTHGYQLLFGSTDPKDATPVTQMFDDVAAVGMPMLPQGVMWTAHYLDEDTGLFMRAVADFDIVTNDAKARWDVLVG